MINTDCSLRGDWMLAILAVVIAFLVGGNCGCAGALTNLGHDVSQGAFNTITSDAGASELSGLTKDIVASARDEALGPETNKQMQLLLSDANKTIEAELTKLLEMVRQQLRLVIREAIDEALGEKTIQEIGAMREQLAGAPLREDLRLAIEGITPELDQAFVSAVNASVSPIKTQAELLKEQADAEAVKWKPIALGFVIGSAFLLIGLILGLVLFVLHERSHRKIIEALTK
jgi:hypothetical protein